MVREVRMRALAPSNDGMGSLLYPDGTCRFRVWAPYAHRVQVMGDFTSWNSAPLDLAPEGSSGNAGYVVGPFPSARQPFVTPAFQDFIIYQLHVGSYAGRNDGIPVTANTATFVNLIAKLDYIRGLGFNGIGRAHV